jgi:hypothetical protein
MQVQDAVFRPLFTSLDEALAGTHASQSDSEEDDQRPRKRARRDSDTALASLCTQSAMTSDTTAVADPRALRQALSKWVFEVASSESTRDINRKRLYAFLKSVGADGVDEDEGDI